METLTLADFGITEADATLTSEAEKMQEEHLEKLYASIKFPVNCIFCEEELGADDEDIVIHNQDRLGGFDLNSDKPYCTDCKEMMEDNANDNSGW